MKALSIMQPWAWLIVNGHKDVENRSWSTSFRGPVLIHAGKKYDGDRDEGDYGPPPWRWEWPDIERPDSVDMGGIVGQAEIVDCVTFTSSRWFCAPYAFIIRNARPLPFQACRGALGFFEPDFTPPAPRPVKAPRQASLL
jgi:hypothetical protein